jgi:hypothetical protein
MFDRPAQQAFADPQFAVPMRCQRSSAATHVSNGTSMIRRNDSDPPTGTMLAFMLALPAG